MCLTIIRFKNLSNLISGFISMSLNQSDNLFLSLVRCAVSGKCDDSSAFSGKDLTWIIKTSNMQGVPALVADGLQIYLKSNPNSNLFANETAAEKLRRIQWLGSVVAYERMYAKHEKAMADLAQLYVTKDIQMMVIKGYGLSLDWPVPNHRLLEIWISTTLVNGMRLMLWWLKHVV